MTKPRYRLAVDVALTKGATVHLREQVAHYMTNVLRLREGDAVALFNREHGEWRAIVAGVYKKEVALKIESLLRAREPARFQLTVCFAPIKGGRLETIIEKATELGASVLQPVITARTIVDKVNLERAEAIAREAAEQCERLDWPEIREPVKLMNMLGDWPGDVLLIYGDERGESESILELVTPGLSRGPAAPHSLTQSKIDGWIPAQGRDDRLENNAAMLPHSWAILTGPEGGFTPEEFASLSKVKAAKGVGLGPRILRADTAVISLCVATLMAWGDWDQFPAFKLGQGTT